MEPLISVIMPVYNAEKYLTHAIVSVINQTYKNLEIILVDDCSTDASGSIIEDFKSRDSRIKVIRNQESKGAAFVRNLALDSFTGEYVVFVDADDYIHPKYVEILYKTLIDSSADIACCNFIRTGKNSEDFSLPEVSSGTTRTMSGLEASLNIVDRKSMYYVVFWNKLYKRYIWEDLRLPEGKRSEDFYVSYKVLSRALKVAFTDAKLYYYFQQNKSVMHVFADFSVYVEEALDDFEGFLRTNIEDESTYKKYSDLSLIFRTDVVVEDYWKAYKKGDKQRISETQKRANELKDIMKEKGIPLRFKFKLFYGSLFLYRIGRGLFDIKESISISLGIDKEGKI